MKDPAPFSPPSKSIKVCNKCLTVIGAGKNHQCSKASFQSNIAGFVKKRSLRSRGKVTSSMLKSVAADQEVSFRGGLVNLQSGSNLLPVKIGTPKSGPKQTRFSHEHLKRIQASHNLSDKAIK